MAIAPGVHGRTRLRLLQLHRLLEFEAAFDGYLRGECTAEFVKVRAKKMLACGLPEFVALEKKK